MKNAEKFSYHRLHGVSIRDLERWMRRRRYQKIDFDGQDFTTSTYWGSKEIFYKIEFDSDLDVYYREGSYGGLIVVEMRISPGKIAVRGYCPWLIFGLFNVKWSFKERPLSWMKYRKEGYHDIWALKRWLDEFG